MNKNQQEIYLKHLDKCLEKILYKKKVILHSLVFACCSNIDIIVSLTSYYKKNYNKRYTYIFKLCNNIPSQLHNFAIYMDLIKKYDIDVLRPKSKSYNKIYKLSSFSSSKSNPSYVNMSSNSLSSFSI